MDKKSLETLVKESIQKTFEGKFPKKVILQQSKAENKLSTTVEKIAEKTKSIVESVVLLPKVWSLRTERLSLKTKETHYELYKKYLEAANKISIKLDAASKEEANSNYSVYRCLKMDETENKNSAILHELYFGNISDLVSEIHLDSLAYMRLARDWGSFDLWQTDLLACCMSAREGWVVCYLDPYKNRYANCVIDGNSQGIPVGGIPVIVMDMHSHAYHHDYLTDKKLYVLAMMKEIHWEVVEARIVVAERANLHNLFAIMPIPPSNPEKLIPNIPQNQPPIGKDQIVAPDNSTKEQ